MKLPPAILLLSLLGLLQSTSCSPVNIRPPSGLYLEPSQDASGRSNAAVFDPTKAASGPCPAEYDASSVIETFTKDVYSTTEITSTQTKTNIINHDVIKTIEVTSSIPSYVYITDVATKKYDLEVVSTRFFTSTRSVIPVTQTFLAKATSTETIKHTIHDTSIENIVVPVTQTVREDVTVSNIQTRLRIESTTLFQTPDPETIVFTTTKYQTLFRDFPVSTVTKYSTIPYKQIKTHFRVVEPEPETVSSFYPITETAYQTFVTTKTQTKTSTAFMFNSYDVTKTLTSTIQIDETYTVTKFKTLTNMVMNSKFVIDYIGVPELLVKTTTLHHEDVAFSTKTILYTKTLPYDWSWFGSSARTISAVQAVTSMVTTTLPMPSSCSELIPTTYDLRIPINSFVFDRNL